MDINTFIKICTNDNFVRKINFQLENVSKIIFGIDGLTMDELYYKHVNHIPDKYLPEYLEDSRDGKHLIILDSNYKLENNIIPKKIIFPNLKHLYIANDILVHNLNWIQYHTNLETIHLYRIHIINGLNCLSKLSEIVIHLNYKNMKINIPLIPYKKIVIDNDIFYGFHQKYILDNIKISYDERNKIRVRRLHTPNVRYMYDLYAESPTYPFEPYHVCTRAPTHYKQLKYIILHKNYKKVLIREIKHM